VKARSRAARRERGEAGVSTLEVVLLAPLMMLFVLTLVYLGYCADYVGKVQSAAQDAARMGSLQRGTTNATTYATDVASADLGTTCNSQTRKPIQITVKAVSTTGGTGTPSRVLQVTITCSVTVLTVSYSITESAYAPINFYSGQT